MAEACAKMALSSAFERHFLRELERLWEEPMETADRAEIRATCHKGDRRIPPELVQAIGFAFGLDIVVLLTKAKVTDFATSSFVWCNEASAHIDQALIISTAAAQAAHHAHQDLQIAELVAEKIAKAFEKNGAQPEGRYAAQFIRSRRW